MLLLIPIEKFIKILFRDKIESKYFSTLENEISFVDDKN